MPRPSFAHGAWAGSAPLLLWALHFAACYVAAAVGCMTTAGRAAPGGVTVFIGVVTAAALAVAAWLVAAACSRLRRESGDLLPRVRLIVTILALVGIAWTGIPAVWLQPCG